LDQSSNVAGAISYYGASNLETILAQSNNFGRNLRSPALELLLGALPDAVPELARLASPVAHVGSGDPPLLLLHGDADPQMPVAQSIELAEAYRAKALDVELDILAGARHGG